MKSSLKSSYRQIRSQWRASVAVSRAGIDVSTIRRGDSYVTVVQGLTYPVRGLLLEMGGRFNPLARSWEFPPSVNVSPRIARALANLNHSAA